MNAFALPALALARRSATAVPAAFADLPSRSPAPDIVRLESTEHSAGRGAGVYIADALADEALLAEHPRFVFATRNARIFRLLPQGGTITVEQGGARGDGTSDDRDAIQATIAYAEAVGAGIVRFEQDRYRLHCPIRLSPADDTRALDGHPLVVRGSLRLEGRPGARSVLDFRGVDGADPSTDYQLVPTSATDPALSVWRGGGLFVDGDASRPDGSLAIERIELCRLTFRGNRQRTGDHAWPADPATGKGWDISDKAFWVQDCHVGDIVLTETDLLGWRGEIFYVGGAVDAVRSLTLERCRFLTSDGSAFNPGTNMALLARDCEFGDAYLAHEETGKRTARFIGCTFRDCTNCGIGSGPTTAHRYNFGYPTRDPDSPLPLTELEDCTFRSIDQVMLSGWTRGRIRLIDSQIVVDTQFVQAVRDVDLDVEAWLDRGEGLTALSLWGPPNLTVPVAGAPEGVYHEPPRRLRFRIRHYRTALAEAAGRNWRSAIWGGYIAPSCRIECEGDYAHAQLPHGETVPVSMPYISLRGTADPAYTPHGAIHVADFSGYSEFRPSAPVLSVACANDALADVTPLSEPAGGAGYGYAGGQTLRLIKATDTGQIRFRKNELPWHYEMLETRVLSNAHDWIEFVFNPNLRRWDEAGFFTSA